MLKEKKGSIINIGSMASYCGDLGVTAYGAAKAGVNFLTMTTALQYGKQNIRCNCIRPGLILTKETEPYLSKNSSSIHLWIKLKSTATEIRMISLIWQYIWALMKAAM